MVWKLFLWSSLRKSYSICLENSDLAKLWPFKTKIWPFFGKNWLFWEFLTYNFQTQLWIFLIFGTELLWISTLSGEPIILCLVLENWCWQSRKSLAPPILGPFWSKFGSFWVQHIFKTCLWLGTWSKYSNRIHFLKALWNSFVMTLFFSFQMWEQMWELM